MLMEKMPFLPVEEEGRLNDMRLRENFIVRVFCYNRWQKMVQRDFQIKDLVQFHTQHKFLLMAHSEKHLRQLGKLVAAAKSHNQEEVKSAYAQVFFEALRRKSTKRKNTSVLQHILGNLKKLLHDYDKKELLATIEDYRRGLINSTFRENFNHLIRN